MGQIEQVEIQSRILVDEQITGVPGATTEQTVRHTAYSRFEQRLASNLESRDVYAAIDYTIPVGGSITINLKAMPFTQGNVDLSGLSIAAILLICPSTNVAEVTLATAVSNGYTLPGGASFKVLPGGRRIKRMTTTTAVVSTAYQLTLSGTSGDKATIRILGTTPEGTALITIPTARTGLARIDGGGITQTSQSVASNLLPRGWLERVQIDAFADAGIGDPTTWDELASGVYAAQTSPSTRQLLTDLQAWYHAAVPGSSARSGYLAPQSWHSEWEALTNAFTNRYPLTVNALRPPLTTISTRSDDGVKTGTITEVDQDGSRPRFRTAAAHGLLVNDLVEVIGVSTDYNGIYKVQAVAGTTRFTTEDTFVNTIGTVTGGTFNGLNKKIVNLSNPTEAALAADAAVQTLAEQKAIHGTNFVWLDELADTAVLSPDTQKDWVSVTGPWCKSLAERLRAVGIRVAFNATTMFCSKGGVRRAYQQAGTGYAIFETNAVHGMKPGDVFTVTGNPRPELNTTHTAGTGTLGRTLATTTPMTSGSEGLGGLWQTDRTPSYDLLCSADMLMNEGRFQQNYMHQDSFYQKCVDVRYCMAKGLAFYHFPRFFSNLAAASKNVGTTKDNGAGKVRITFGTDPTVYTHDKIAMVGHSVAWNGPHTIKDFSQYDVSTTSVTNNGGNAQFNCSSAHGLVVNDKVRVLTGVYAGELTVLSVQSTTALTLNVAYSATATDKLRVFWLDLDTAWNASPGAGNGGKIIIHRFARPVAITNIQSSAGVGSPWRVTCAANHNIFPNESPWVTIYGQSATFTEGTEYNIAEVVGQPTKFDIVGTTSTGSTLTGGVVFDARADRRFLALLFTILAEQDGKFFINHTIGSAMGDWPTLPAQLGAPTQEFSEALITYDADGYATSMTRTFEHGTVTVNPKDRYGSFTIT